MAKTNREVVVFVTTSSKKVAKAIASVLVGERLAACATVVGVVESIYRWHGKVHRGKESMLMVKTTAGRYHELEQRVLALHSYETPEIIAMPIVNGLPAYLSWIRRETSK